MKNTIFIDIDTEREKVVRIGKPNTTPMPDNPEDAKKMILDDISCVCEGLCTLIHTADQANYAEKESLVNAAIAHLNNLLIIGVTDTKQQV